MARALRYDGWMAARVSEAELPALRDYLEAHRPTDRPFDVMWEGRTPGDDPPRRCWLRPLGAPQLFPGRPTSAATRPAMPPACCA